MDEQKAMQRVSDKGEEDTATKDFFASLQEHLGGVPVNWEAFQERTVVVGEDVTEVVSMFGNRIRTGESWKEMTWSVV